MAEKLRPVTVWLQPELLDRVERLAAADRRPASQLIRNLLADAVAARPADAVGAPAHAAA
jgi:predicted transcriptional regulator